MSKRGEVNGWVCQRCGQGTYAIHVDDGVTPMFLACRATDNCGGRGTSLMYPPDPPSHVLQAVAWEWYMPDKAEQRAIVDPNLLEHISKGGLRFRELTEAGRTVLKRFHDTPEGGEEK